MRQGWTIRGERPKIGEGERGGYVQVGRHKKGSGTRGLRFGFWVLELGRVGVKGLKVGVEGLWLRAEGFARGA